MKIRIRVSEAPTGAATVDLLGDDHREPDAGTNAVILDLDPDEQVLISNVIGRVSRPERVMATLTSMLGKVANALPRQPADASAA